MPVLIREWADAIDLLDETELRPRVRGVVCDALRRMIVERRDALYGREKGRAFLDRKSVV